MNPKQIFITTCKSIGFFIGFGVLCTLGSELFMCVNLRDDPEVFKIFIDFMAAAAGIFCFFFGFGSLGMVFMIWDHDRYD